MGQTEESALEESRTAPVALRALHILVAEDDRVNRLMLERLLSKQGHRVISVPDGRQCLEALERQDVDLILMDIQMPEMDGLEATRKIRDRKDHKRDIPIIAITAHAMKGDCEKFILAGMNECLSKPVKLSEITNALRLASI